MLCPGSLARVINLNFPNTTERIFDRNAPIDFNSVAGPYPETSCFNYPDSILLNSRAYRELRGNVPGASRKSSGCTGSFEETYRELRGKKQAPVKDQQNRKKKMQTLEAPGTRSKLPVHIWRAFAMRSHPRLDVGIRSEPANPFLFNKGGIRPGGTWEGTKKIRSSRYTLEAPGTDSKLPVQIGQGSEVRIYVNT